MDKTIDCWSMKVEPIGSGLGPIIILSQIAHKQSPDDDN